MRKQNDFDRVTLPETLRAIRGKTFTRLRISMERLFRNLGCASSPQTFVFLSSAKMASYLNSGTMCRALTSWLRLLNNRLNISVQSDRFLPTTQRFRLQD